MGRRSSISIVGWRGGGWQVRRSIWAQEQRPSRVVGWDEGVWWWGPKEGDEASKLVELQVAWPNADRQDLCYAPSQVSIISINPQLGRDVQAAVNGND